MRRQHRVRVPPAPQDSRGLITTQRLELRATLDADASSTPVRQRFALIVERDSRVRELQRFFLEKAGYAVDFVEDGQAAFDRAVATLPDLIVTEILVPRLDGLTLCRRLRDESMTHHIPVMVFSILSAASRATEAGAQAFLRKPIVEATFIGAIDTLMAAQSTRRTDRP